MYATCTVRALSFGREGFVSSLRRGSKREIRIVVESFYLLAKGRHDVCTWTFWDHIFGFEKGLTESSTLAFDFLRASTMWRRSWPSALSKAPTFCGPSTCCGHFQGRMASSLGPLRRSCYYVSRGGHSLRSTGLFA